MLSLGALLTRFSGVRFLSRFKKRRGRSVTSSVGLSSVSLYQRYTAVKCSSTPVHLANCREMRLINTRDLELYEFFGDAIPAYAILYVFP